VTAASDEIILPSLSKEQKNEAGRLAGIINKAAGGRAGGRGTGESVLHAGALCNPETFSRLAVREIARDSGRDRPIIIIARRCCCESIVARR